MQLKQLCHSIVAKVLRKREPLFGGWRITEFLGEGGFACVYKIINKRGKMEFVSALKIVPVIEGLTFQTSPGQDAFGLVGRYIREVQTLTGISSHPNLVSLQNFDVIRFQYKGGPSAIICIMMDYLPNTLDKAIKAERFSIEKGLDLISGCLNGLQHVHEHDIIHRDIKPANIFLDEYGKAMIGDFGIAGSMAEALSGRKVAGTLSYMAPEALSDPRKKGYSPGADIYSMGLVAYEVLTGSLPFENDYAIDETVSRRMEGEPIEYPEGIPTDLAAILSQALAYNPDERFESAAQFNRTILGFKEALPIM